MIAKLKTWWLGVLAWLGSEKAKAMREEQEIAAKFEANVGRAKKPPPAA